MLATMLLFFRECPYCTEEVPNWIDIEHLKTKYRNFQERADWIMKSYLQMCSEEADELLEIAYERNLNVKRYFVHLYDDK